MIYYLQDAMKIVLRKKAKQTPPKEIAEVINKIKIFENVDGTAVSETDVKMRAIMHPEMFRYNWKEDLISFNPSYREPKKETEEKK